MAKKKFDNSMFNYNNIEKKNKNFMYQNLQRSKCFNSNFPQSNFDYVSFRGAHLKSCSFLECSFKWAEFVGTNLKGSAFRKAHFENTIFKGAKLEDVNFVEATFKNTIFVGCDIESVINLDFSHPEIRIFDEMPELNISEPLREAVEKAMTNKYIKKSRVLDTKDKKINSISIMLLLEQFDEETLIKGLQLISEIIDKEFSVLSYIISAINRLIKDGQMQ
ncbi:MAG: pentapeptide repeat-containing protein [Clostridiales bacterium]|nr:pentapeptide repeat-containing protein [Clostridiales bacterium]